MYRIRILDAATRELAQLDRPVGRRVIERVHWLGANFDVIRPEALTGDLTGFYKLRIGDYRVIYQVLADEQTIVIHAIGHRRDIYKRR